jgi:hypothetical protein
MAEQYTIDWLIDWLLMEEGWCLPSWYWNNWPCICEPNGLLQGEKYLASQYAVEFLPPAEQ